MATQPVTVLWDMRDRCVTLVLLDTLVNLRTIPAPPVNAQATLIPMT